MGGSEYENAQDVGASVGRAIKIAKDDGRREEWASLTGNRAWGMV